MLMTLMSLWLTSPTSKCTMVAMLGRLVTLMLLMSLLALHTCIRSQILFQDWSVIFGATTLIAPAVKTKIFCSRSV